VAPAEGEAAVAPEAQAQQPTTLEQAEDLLTDPKVTLTPEQRTELEQYVQSWNTAGAAVGQELRSRTPHHHPQRGRRLHGRCRSWRHGDGAADGR
jgi:hypothetical protein